VVLFASYASNSGAGYEFALSFVGLCALLGHQFSIFLRFRGGKGVGTALGVYLAISPLSCLGALALFILLVLLWDFVSLGSIVSAFAMPLFLALFGKPLPFVVGGLIIAVLIFFKHKDNIHRLARGEERKWRDDRNHVSRSRSLSSSSSE
jgi:glycerol-3-phosphate acyltransferase PlsY